MKRLIILILGGIFPLLFSGYAVSQNVVLQDVKTMSRSMNLDISDIEYKSLLELANDEINRNLGILDPNRDKQIIESLKGIREDFLNTQRFRPIMFKYEVLKFTKSKRPKTEIENTIEFLVDRYHYRDYSMPTIRTNDPAIAKREYESSWAAKFDKKGEVYTQQLMNAIYDHTLREIDTIENILKTRKQTERDKKAAERREKRKKYFDQVDEKAKRDKEKRGW